MQELQTGSFSKAPPNAQECLVPVAWLLGANREQSASATPVCDGVFDARLETTAAGEDEGEDGVRRNVVGLRREVGVPRKPFSRTR